MSVKKYLTLDGLTYFLNKIKSTMADELDGKANDSEVVHKAQTETVTGEKTFKKDVKIIDLNANERPGVKFEVNGSFRTFEQAKDSLPDPDFGDFEGGTLWSGGFLADNTKIQNSMGDYVINDITFGTANYSSVIEFNNYYKVTYEDGHNSPEDVTGMLRFELAPYENVEKDHEYWSDPDLYFYAMLDGGFSGGSTILGHPRAPWSKAYIGEINCDDIKFFGGMFSISDALQNIRNLSYVTHYSSTALTPSSTNSNTLLDNTDNLKVGDKVIDSDGVLFSITAIDTANSTFTVGSALVDLALDANVVHTSEINSSGIGIIESVKEVGGVDFNTLTTQGLYGTNASGSTNNPVASPCVVQVIKRQNSVIQIANVSSSAYKSRYIRYCADITAQPPVWQSWIKFATDDNVMHLSGNETISGTKTFTDNIVAKKIVANVSQLQINAKTNADSVAMIGGDSASEGGGVWVYGKNTSNKSMVTLQVYDTDNSVYHAVRLNMDGSLTPTVSNNGLGSSSYKWVSFNGINPGALSLPDLNNGIDISSYITHLDKVVNSYTPSVNGWISIRVKKTSLAHTSLMIYQTGGLLNSYKTDEYNISGTNLPVIANQKVEIYIYADVLVEAKFYPCMGNV